MLAVVEGILGGIAVYYSGLYQDRLLINEACAAAVWHDLGSGRQHLLGRPT